MCNFFFFLTKTVLVVLVEGKEGLKKDMCRGNGKQATNAKHIVQDLAQD
jgi:hypothetical protein